ncbi:MAG: hypothetical protein Q9191_000875 [Dirinaria sp. TL-2023a]
MPSFPCPYCEVKYGKREVLETHIRFRHQVAQSVGHEAESERTATSAVPGAPTTATTPTGLTPGQMAAPMAGSYAPTQQALTITVPMGPPSPYFQTSASRFTIVFDTRDMANAESMTVPVKEPFAPFMDRLKVLSAPVVGRYLQGRTDGFTLADGAWRYALVDFNGNQEACRRLDSNLFYLAMMSELRRGGSPYAYALIWNDAQDAPMLSLEGTTTTTSPPGTYQPPTQQLHSHDQPSISSHDVDEAPYLASVAPVQQPLSPLLQGPGQARTPTGILQRREENGNVFYRVNFLEGGPCRWMPIEELQILGHQAMIDGWEQAHGSLAV